MDISSFDILGKQFSDFLTRQFTPPPGTQCVLGFLGAGAAVEPESFLSDDVFNLARVNTWLDIVAEPLAAIGTNDNHVAATPFTALSLMQAVCTQARTPADSDDETQVTFNKIKSQAMENLGGATTVQTAPLDWYDPKHLPEWAKCNLNVSTDSSSGSTSSTPPVISSTPPVISVNPPLQINPRLWSWRQLSEVHIVDPLSPVAVAPVASSTALVSSAIDVIPNRVFHLSNASLLSSSAASSAVARPIGVSHLAMESTQFRDVVFNNVNRPVLGTIDANINSRLRIDRAVLLAKEVDSAANTASTSSVATSSLTLNLSYLVVPVSREPWWNEMLLLMNKWYIPSLVRGALIGESDPSQMIGVPIAMILTANVQVQANWSATDRAAATSSTHLGPWALNSSQFSESSTTGQATLTISGMQAIAFIYRKLPVLPPLDSP